MIHESKYHTVFFNFFIGAKKTVVYKPFLIDHCAWWR